MHLSGLASDHLDLRQVQCRQAGEFLHDEIEVARIHRALDSQVGDAIIGHLAAELPGRIDNLDRLHLAHCKNCQCYQYEFPYHKLDYNAMC